MKHLTSMMMIVSLSLGFGVSLTACSKSSPCDKLAKALCDGKDDATCKKTKAWLDSEMTGPNGEKLSQGQSDLACKMILDDKDSLAAYKQQASEKVK